MKNKNYILAGLMMLGLFSIHTAEALTVTNKCGADIRVHIQRNALRDDNPIPDSVCWHAPQTHDIPKDETQNIKIDGNVVDGGGTQCSLDVFAGILEKNASGQTTENAPDINSGCYPTTTDTSHVTFQRELDSFTQDPVCICKE